MIEAPMAPPGAWLVSVRMRPIRGLTEVLRALVLGVVAVQGVFALWPGTFTLDGHSGAPWMVATTAAVAILGTAWVVVAIMWMHRARSNAEAIRPGGAWGSAWAIGAWFVPYAYLVLGYFVVREIWVHTMARDAGEEPPAWLTIGWLLWALPLAWKHLVAFQMGQWFQWGLPAGPAGLGPEGTVPFQIQAATFFVLHVVAAVFFLRFIRLIARVQEPGSNVGGNAVGPQAA